MADETTAEEAAKRVRFLLSYKPDQHKKTTGWGLEGTPLPNAYHESRRLGLLPPLEWRDRHRDVELSTGTWDNYEPPGRYDEPTDTQLATEEEWQKFWLDNALNEAVHEALEWFWVDGRPLIDPHGPHEMAIFRAVSDLVSAIWALQEPTSAPARRSARTDTGEDI